MTPASQLRCLPPIRHRRRTRELLLPTLLGDLLRGPSPTTGFGMGGKKRGGEPHLTAGRTGNQSVSLREESSGKTTRVDEASVLRVKHLQRLVAWAGAEAGVGPVGALLGRRLAASAEVAGVSVGAATFLCQRCETILRPGFNCTVRIRNKRNKTKQQKKSNCCQNSVAYACHFCSDQNLILGSGKRVVKSLLSSREQASTDSTCRNFRGHKSNTRTKDMKEVCEHSQASSSFTQSTSATVEQDERLKSSLPTNCKMDDGATLPSKEPDHLTVSTFEVRSIRKTVLGNANDEQKAVSGNANDEHMQETEPVSYRNSSKKMETCEVNVTLKTDFMAGSKFVTPQKNKLMDSADPFNTKSTRNKKGEASHLAAGKTLGFSMSVPNDSRKHSKSATGDADQGSVSSRKRARRGWTTLKQIAEKDEIERKEKMGSFVIPFFMQ